MREIKFEKNAFDLIRYGAAFAVMMTHYTSLYRTQRIQGVDGMWKIEMAVNFFPGVVVLFALSGLLVAASCERSGSRSVFFRKRVWRLYPELWGCTLVNLCVVAMLAFRSLDGSIFGWLLTQFFGIANTPSCLKQFATGSVNGALWTIGIEVQLYIVLGLIYPMIKKMRTWQWLLFLGGLAGCNVAAGVLESFAPQMIIKLLERCFLSYALWFFIGVFCYVKRSYMLKLLQISWPVLLLVYTVVYKQYLDLPGYYANIVVGLLLPLIVIGLGYTLPGVRIPCDLSYEMFLYHWIVLNVIVHFDLMNRLTGWMCLSLYIVMTLAVSWGSWRWLGKGRRIQRT